MKDVSIVIPRLDGEIRVSLHPISLALIVAELIEEASVRRCRRRGHASDLCGYCERCGRSLPDTDNSPSSSWHPGAYRSWSPRPVSTDSPASAGSASPTA